MTPVPNERSSVELPLIRQLQGLGWDYKEGDKDVPYLTERETFRQVLLTDRLRQAVRRINLGEDGQPWLDEGRINDAVDRLERLTAHSPMEANQQATQLLIKGTVVEGDPERHGGRDVTVHFIDFEHPERNDFLVINQFRVDPPWAVADRDFIVPDVVLFVNGIPLVVIECKSPGTTDPMEEGITQLLRYSNQRDWVEGREGAERLFHYNQIMVSTWFFEARAGAVGASYEHYMEWKDTYPLPMADVAQDLGVGQLRSQNTLVAGMFRKEHLLDIVCNFTLFQQSGGKTIKIIPRYHQFRAVYEALERLRTGQTRLQHGEFDQRGGIVWHTQGSGKSISMVYLVRKMRMEPDLRRFKVVVVTDRIDLEKQLSETASLTGETVRKAMNTKNLQDILVQQGPDLVFAMIQKYQERALETKVLRYPDVGERTRLAKVAETDGDTRDKGRELRVPVEHAQFPVLNESEYILVLVDEAHRSQTNDLHANLMHALPNCAKIGFTGTPILTGDRKLTHQIFGEFFTPYTLQQSQEDGSTVEIKYEGRAAQIQVKDYVGLDELFEEMFRDRTAKELEAIKKKCATLSYVLEAPELVAAKARDILRHYVSTVLPNGMKAQLVAVSRLGAVRYQAALATAKEHLVRELEAIDPALPTLREEDLETQDLETRFLVRAHKQLETIRGLAFAAVISSGTNDDPAWKQWTRKNKQDGYIKRFNEPLVHEDPTRRDGLAFLCVQSMLLTGFDAPVEQVLYLDRFMWGHELLQTIARVNRRYKDKSHGLVVDYFGVARHLNEALELYSAEDVQGALESIEDELPKLDERYRRVLAVFHDRGIIEISDVNTCVDLLRDVKIRADFVVKLKLFLESLDMVLPRPEGLKYVRDAKILGFINKAAANLYRDSQLNLMGVGQKVRQFIDDHIMANGIDPKIPPISILDAGFGDAVDARVSVRARASEMEHAARHHISHHFSEDPVYYRKLSERLEEILRTFQDNWDELVKALREFTREMREGHPADESGLDPQTQAPFLRLLVAEIGEKTDPTGDDLTRLAGHTIAMVDQIRQEIGMVDFWRNAYAQSVLRQWLAQYLDDNDLVPFKRQQALADQFLELAKARHTRLVT